MGGWIDKYTAGRVDLFPASLALHQRLSSLQVLDALRQRFHPPALRRECVLGRAEPVAPAGRTEAVLVEQTPDGGEDDGADRDDDGDDDDDRDERLLFTAELHAPERPRVHAASISCCQCQSDTGQSPYIQGESKKVIPKSL